MTSEARHCGKIRQEPNTVLKREKGTVLGSSLISWFTLWVALGHGADDY